MTAAHWKIQRRVALPGTCEEVLLLQRSLAGTKKRHRRFTEKDLFLLIQHAVLALGVAAMPVGWWQRLCGLTSFKRRTTRRRRELAPFKEKLRDVAGLGDEAELDALYDAVQVRLDQRHMTYLRELDRRREIGIEIPGKGHLAASLARAAGAVLWNTPALGCTIITKRALWQAGMPAHQLSVRSHGFSQTPFAVRHVNPGQIKVEDRYLAGRIWFDGPDAIGATREAMRRLKSNVPVLFTNSLFAGRSFVAVSVGARFHLPLATTPLSIAVKMGVPMHVFTTIEEAPFSRYLTHISPALTLRGGTDTDTQIANLALQARDILLDFARAYPDQIRIWDSLIDLEDLQPQIGLK